MADSDEPSSAYENPQPEPIDEPSNPALGSSPLGSQNRATSTARLGSPVPSYPFGTPPVRQIPTPAQFASNQHSGTHTPAELETSKGPVPSIPTESALAAALRGSYSSSPPRFGTPPIRPLSPASAALEGRGPRTNYGSIEQRPSGSPILHDNLEIVKRHLAGPSALSSSPRGRPSTLGPTRESSEEAVGQGLADDEFSSLRLQGGDVTRPIYRLVEQQAAEAQGISRPRRRSFDIERDPPPDETLNIASIKQPGGFRRNYIRRAVASPSPDRDVAESSAAGRARQDPHILTTSFIEFLSLYGHFAGEEFDEEEEESEDYFSPEGYTAEEGEAEEYGERSALLGAASKRPRARRRRTEKAKRGGSPMGAAMLLLKSFVGTGVLFLPKAFLNGGMLFSCFVLLGIAILSYYCFLLLCSTRAKVPLSFGEMGFKLYGNTLRFLINFSLVISQIGFSSAYIVFVSENLQAFILAVSKCKTDIAVKWLILMQMIIFLPLSLYRNIQNIQKIAVAADIFILLGLLYLYYFDIFTLVSQHGVADIKEFNANSWTLFIGTAIFTFEGIGLIIPIQESMREPSKFPAVLGVIMVIITVIFTSMGALSYAAYGSKTRTVVILNMPQDNRFVNAVQFIYSLAILLSTPLQFFPAIEITSLAIFKRTGKNDPVVKWKKNFFRFCMVVVCAAIAWVGADDLDKFVALVGSFACIPLVYIYPVRTISFLFLSLSLSSSVFSLVEASADLHSHSRCSTIKPCPRRAGRRSPTLF